jgi:serine/threonine-protein kinase
MALRRHDAWIERDVLALPLDDDTLALVRTFARAGHPALPAVLRVDLVSREIWISAPSGRALADEPRALSPGQLARLRDAVEALHAAGGAHGCIDPSHLYWHDGEVTLAYPRARPGPNAAELDRSALDRLGGG